MAAFKIVGLPSQLTRIIHIYKAFILFYSKIIIMTFFPYQDTRMRPNDASDSDTPDPSDDEQDSAADNNMEVKPEEVNHDESNYGFQEHDTANGNVYFLAPMNDNANDTANGNVYPMNDNANQHVPMAPNANMHAPNRSFLKSMATRHLKPNRQVLAHDPVFDAPHHIPHISFQSAHSSF